MTEIEYWQRKLRCWAGYELAPRAYKLACGADTPFFGPEVGSEPSPLLVTHPLQPGLQLQLTETTENPRQDKLFRDVELRLLEEQAPSVQRSQSGAAWRDAHALRARALVAWRAQPTLDNGQLRLQPAARTSPDHSEHARRRVAAAACFVTEETPSEPCLVSVRLHGVQEFITETRKTQDLWSASMIYGELVWAAMEVILSYYGPENILYPDLLENPMMDQWLIHQGGELAEAVPELIRKSDAPTASVPIPHTFTCLLPRGGEDAGHLIPIATLMSRAKEAVEKRWREMTDATQRRITRAVGDGPWTEIWNRSLCTPPELSWTATPWELGMQEQGRIPPGLRALPGHHAGEPVVALPEVLQRREARLRPWVSGALWRRMEEMRHVLWVTASAMETDLLGDERGFDYPLAHARMLALHDVTSRARRPQALTEPGEKCTITGRHEALTNTPAEQRRDLRAHRDGARALSARLYGDDGERLGAPAALKRFLPSADEPGFIRRWAGARPPPQDLRAPYPSTAGLAAGPFLWKLIQHQVALEQPLRRFVDAHRASGLDQETQHPLALPWLINSTRSGPLGRLLCTEAQHLSPEVLGTFAEKAKGTPNAAAIQRLQGALAELRAAARDGGLGAPEEEYAVLFMDGDGISRLIAGDPDVIRANWRDVLHPSVVEQLQAAGQGWLGQLDRPRTTGPSLHAAITRMLADLTDRIVPWVVEVEFAGRMVYAGGDDILAILPASHAIPAAARIQQLFSAPFVVDTGPHAPWSWRRDGARPCGPEAAQRFQIPKLKGAPEGPWACERPITLEGEQDERHLTLDKDTRLFPMLGRAHSLSAGIAFGHFKTPLQLLISTAKDVLDTCSKPAVKARVREGLAPQGHLTIARFTGSGAKSIFTSPWTLDESGGQLVVAAPNLHAHLQQVSRAFQHRELAARLPYQLREALVTLLPVLEGDPEDPSWPALAPEQLIHQLVIEQVGGASDASRSVELLVLAGLEAHLRAHRAPRTTPSAPLDEVAHQAVAGLLIARHFAGADQ